MMDEGDRLDNEIKDIMTKREDIKKKLEEEKELLRVEQEIEKERHNKEDRK